MATESQTPTIIQNENLHIHKGKREAVDRSKKEKGPKDRRKALADLSKKPPATQKGAANPKAKPSSLRDPESWTDGLTDEEIRSCREWAKDGIEQVHFTGNDERKLEREIQEERVRKEVEMVMSSLQILSQMEFDSFFKREESTRDFEDITSLELEPEVDLPSPKLPFFSGYETEDSLLEDEPSIVSLLGHDPMELKLEDSDDEIL